MKTYPLIIDGKPVVTRNTFDVRNPATGEVYARCSVAESSHLDQAVEAAQRAFEPWSRTPDSVRKEHVGRLADALQKNAAELMEILTCENGKPLQGYQGIGSGMDEAAARLKANFATLPPEQQQEIWKTLPPSARQMLQNPGSK